MLVTYSPKCIRQIFICLNIEIPLWVSATEQFFMGMLGTLICLVFFWKRQKFEILSDFKASIDFEKPTAAEVDDFVMLN
jgi:hypothetical protein